MNGQGAQAPFRIFRYIKKRNMRKSAKQQVEEIEMARFMLYLEGLLFSGGIVLTKQNSYIQV